MNGKTMRNTPLTLPGVIIVSTITACGGGSSTSAPTLPSNAVTIDSSNAVDLVVFAASTISSLAVRKPAEGSSPSVRGLFPRMSNMLKNKDSMTDADTSVAVGEVITDSGLCTNGGTYFLSYSEQFISTTYVRNGTNRLTACNEGGLIMDGTIIYNYTESLVSDDYWDSYSGNLETRVIDVFGTQTVRLSGLNYEEHGSLLNNTYTISSYTYAMEIIGTNVSFGMLVSIDSPIVESSGDFCPERGTLRISGANDSFALGQYNGNRVDISVNGVPIGSLSCI